MAATITGTVYRPDGTVYRGNVSFVPKSTPNVDGSTVVITECITSDVNDSGQISQRLMAGDYDVVFKDRCKFTINVPDSTGSFDISAITSSIGDLTMRVKVFNTIAEFQASTGTYTYVIVVDDGNGNDAAFEQSGSGSDNGISHIVNAASVHYTRLVRV